MQNFFAPDGATLTLTVDQKSTTVDLYSSQGLELLSNLWIKVAAQHRLNYEATWLGRPIIQFTTDIVAIQELIWSIRPDVIVETGVAHGGSLILSASVLQLLGRGKVVGVDIEIRPHNRIEIERHPLANSIQLVEGSSIDPKIFAQVQALCAGVERVLVFLDSNHSQSHVAAELELYHTLVTPGSYLVTHDGAQAWVWEIPRGKVEWKEDHPLKAIENFLQAHPEFCCDPHWTRMQITSSPNGYLRRLTEEELAKK